MVFALRMSLQVCYWLRVDQGVSNNLRTNCKVNSSVHMFDVYLVLKRTREMLLSLVLIVPLYFSRTYRLQLTGCDNETSDTCNSALLNIEREPASNESCGVQQACPGVGWSNRTMASGNTETRTSDIAVVENTGSSLQRCLQFHSLHIAIGCSLLEKVLSYFTGPMRLRQHRHGSYVIHLQTVNTRQSNSANQDCYVLTPFQTELPVTGGYNCEVFIYWHRVTHDESNEVWSNDKCNAELYQYSRETKNPEWRLKLAHNAKWCGLTYDNSNASYEQSIHCEARTMKLSDACCNHRISFIANQVERYLVLVFLQVNQGRFHGGVAPGFSHGGIVSDEAAGRHVFSAIIHTPPHPFPLHSGGAAPYSPRFTLIDSQDLDVKSRPYSSALHCTLWTAPVEVLSGDRSLWLDSCWQWLTPYAGGGLERFPLSGRPGGERQPAPVVPWRGTRGMDRTPARPHAWFLRTRISGPL
ncbi:hypothetical protein PR048_018935 [Dryococelus australis]|uniref:Uncharacterized protein n=1 Tax=Dryococelus australis TaxID=614101 RepID=A0ABQ9H250_9NEOP|nr:hypothetical protein PR048_018935 [Dryococelus australis]